MQTKKQQLISALSTLALTLVLSGGSTLPGTVLNNPNPAYLQSPAKYKTFEPDTENGLQPLTDIDEPVTNSPE